ncbi:MAG: ribulose-phosphate 3-epimerase [Desulfobacterales bacterium]|nr:ribulose-phosphate 3-epimerase [Desulfobacterales bacterium]
MEKLIAPSILSADFGRLAEEIRAVEAAGADWIHVDVMDGHFVPNITLGPMIVESVNQVTGLPLDVHLMIENPDKYIPDFIKAGADLVSVHVETCPHLNRTIDLIRTAGCRAGAVLNPATPLASLEWTLEYLDFVLLMSVNPGFGGQSFIPNTLDKIRRLRAMIEETGQDVRIQIDGGVNKNTIQDIAGAGADVFVAGSAIFGTDDYAATIKTFRDLLGG